MPLAAILLVSLSLSSAPPLAPRAWRDLTARLSDRTSIANVDASAAAAALRDRGCGRAVFVVDPVVAAGRSAHPVAMTVVARGVDARGRACQADVVVAVSWRSAATTPRAVLSARR